MSGRLTFEKYSFLIGLCIALIKITPRFLNETIWWILNGSNGRGALMFRYCYLKKYARSLGRNVYVGSGCIFKNLYNLEIADNVSIHDYCYVDSIGGVFIDSNVSIAHASSILSFDHSYDDPTIAIKYNPSKSLPVRIDQDVWVGCGVRILGGALIKSRCVIAAGAVVRGNIESFGVYGGVPAKLLKNI